MRVLFLDDDLNRHKRFRQRMIGHNITFVETPEQAIEALKGEPFTVASLDHDLGGKIFQPSDEKSGFAVCQFIRQMDLATAPCVVLCHSYNPDGVKAMVSELDSFTTTYPAPFDSDEYWDHLPANAVVV